MDNTLLLKDERRLIHLLLTTKLDPSDIETAYPPDLFDPHHIPLVRAIYDEYATNKQPLTRNRYRQKLVEGKANGDLMQSLTVYDKCFTSHAEPQDLGELKLLVREGYAGRLIHFALQNVKRHTRDNGYQYALSLLRDELADDLLLAEGGLAIKTVSDVPTEAIEWLWQDRIAIGKVTLFVGDPDCGKSFTSLHLAARITTGKPMPATPGISNPKGDVLILSSEDGIADTIRPRLEMQGADLTRAHVIEGVAGDDRMFSLLSDLPLLERAMTAYPQTKLLIVDPLNAYLGKTDSHRDADTRRMLSPLCEFADRCHVSVLGIMHMTKDKKGSALYRAQGSIAFVAAARAAWLFTKDQNEPDKILFLQLKNNLAQNPGGLSYRLVQDKGVVWDDGIIEVTADEALRDDRQSPRKDAKEFLLEALKDGPEPSRDSFRGAKEVGIADKTLRRAKDELHIKATQVWEGSQKEWRWSLPTENANNNHEQEKTLAW